MKPLLVFDLDGTLIDSAKDIAVALNWVLNHHNKPAIAHEKVVEHIGDGLRKLLLDFFPENSNDERLQLQLENEFFSAYDREMFTHTQVFPGVKNFLDSWDGPIGIITNKNERPAREVIQHLGLAQYAWVEIFGADTLSEKKPSPLPLYRMMEKAQYQAQHTIMIGDGRPDILSAVAAGTKSLAIGFGYTDAKILVELGAQAVLEHYDHMPQALKKFGY
ncbi:MAG: HAD family hydrolase [Bdellovibrionia bacterium]